MHSSFDAAGSDQLAVLMDWARTLSWNPGDHDLAACWAQDAEGPFWCHQRGGAPVGYLSAVKYEGHFAHLGYYIVKESERGKGFGKSLWDFVLQMPNIAGRTLALDGVLAQVENYKKSGFEIRWTNERFEGLTSGGGVQLRDHPAVRPLAEVAFEKVCEFDRRHFPAQRENFLRAWFRAPHSTGFALMSDSGAVVGYGVIRTSQVGFRVGPLFAETKEGAAELLECLLTSVEGEKEVCLDVPLENENAVELVRELKMAAGFATVRMFKNDEGRRVSDQVTLSQVYGLTTLEFG